MLMIKRRYELAPFGVIKKEYTRLPPFYVSTDLLGLDVAGNSTAGEVNYRLREHDEYVIATMSVTTDRSRLNPLRYPQR